MILSSALMNSRFVVDFGLREREKFWFSIFDLRRSHLWSYWVEWGLVLIVRLCSITCRSIWYIICFGRSLLPERVIYDAIWWLIEKDLWFVIKDKSDLNTFDSIISIISEIQSLDFESQKIDVKAHYWLIICIIINDQEHIANKMSAKEIWDALSYKYKEKLQITERQYLMNFINYRMSTNIFIEKTWTHLVKLTQKIVATQKDISNLFKSERCFQVLLQSLSDEYTVIQNIIDA